MKHVIVEVPETLEEFREYFKERDLVEIPIRSDESYNTRTIGWELRMEGILQASSSSLLGAYKKLRISQIYQEIFKDRRESDPLTQQRQRLKNEIAEHERQIANKRKQLRNIGIGI